MGEVVKYLEPVVDENRPEERVATLLENNEALSILYFPTEQSFPVWVMSVEVARRISENWPNKLSNLLTESAKAVHLYPPSTADKSRTPLHPYIRIQIDANSTINILNVEELLKELINYLSPFVV